MSEVLWTDIDNYLVTNITADMGQTSSYVTLKVNEVLLSDTFKPEHYNPPTIVIFSNVVRPTRQGPHGDGDVHIFSDYRYFLACVDKKRTTYAEAKANAQTLIQRLREVIRSRFALQGLVSSVGEFVYETQVLEMRVEVMGGTVGGEYRGVGMLPFIVRTEV